MIILYESDEKEFTSLGIGVLTDAIECVVSEELNGSFELEMDYPITGVHYSDLKEKRIILAKPNDFQDPQPFRIYKITRPIDGSVTVCAEHISYGMSKVPVRKINAENLKDIAYKGENNKGKLKEGEIINSPFKFFVSDDKIEGTEITFFMSTPNNLRSVLLGNDGSILNIYNGEFIFDKFNVTLCNRRGIDRDFTIRYSKNMIDLEQETSSELMYNGVYPYFSSTTTETKVSIAKKYKEVYLSNDKPEPLKDKDGNDIYPPNWLTYDNKGFGSLKDILDLMVVNIIATEGDFYNHLVTGKRTTPQGYTEEGSYFYDVTYDIAYINPSDPNPYGEYWLYKDEDITQVWIPKNKQVFRIYTPGDNLYKVYIFETMTKKYRLITADDNITEYPPTLPAPTNTQEEKTNLIIYEGDIIYLNEVRAIPKDGEEEFSATWLQAVSENLQIIASDPRWKPEGDILQTIGVPNSTIYKVPQIETGIPAWPIEGVKKDSPGWLTLKKGTDTPQNPDGTPFTPVNKQVYDVETSDEGISKRRWSADNNSYSMATDTRYSYINYEWNGTSYVVHDTVDDQILTWNASDKFKETPKDTAKFQKDLYDETIKYMKDTKMGTLKNSIKVSFVKLSSSPEYSKWKDLETVALGDTVHVIYEDLGVNEVKKVIKTEYNVLTETYDSIEIGDKGTGFTDTAIVEGDSVSSLTNDRNFADITTVTKLVAERIEADFIQAAQASISEAQIDALTTNELSAALITAQKFDIDNLVATLLVADDAAVRNTLVVGEDLVVNGEINVMNGSISISSKERKENAIRRYRNPNAETPYAIDWLLEHEGDAEYKEPSYGEVYIVQNELLVDCYYRWVGPVDAHYEEITAETNLVFEVDPFGNATANSLTITGGSITIEDSQGGSSFEVTKEGVLTAKEAEIEGKITATSGEIGHCIINEDGHLIVPSANVTGTFTADDIVGGTLSGLEIKIGPISGTNPQEYNFEVDEHGNATANSLTITGGSITIEDSQGGSIFGVRDNGHFKANDVDISGGVIGNLRITDKLYFGDVDVIDAYVREYRQFRHVMIVEGHNLSQGIDYFKFSYFVINNNSDSNYGGGGLYIGDIEYPGFDSDLDNRDFEVRGMMEGYDNYHLTSNSDMDNHAYETELSCYNGSVKLTEIFDASSLEILEDSVTDFRYKSDWLSLTPSGNYYTDGPILTPQSNVIYAVYTGNGSFVGYYRWSSISKQYQKQNNPIYYINEDGLELPNISSYISTGITKIAGFNVDSNTITSVTEYSEIGLSSESSSLPEDDLAIWVGKEYTMPSELVGTHPFYVTHDGALHSTKGKIGDFYIKNALTTNENKLEMFDNNEGLYLNSEGISFYEEVGQSLTPVRVSIDAKRGFGATNIYWDPLRVFAGSDKWKAYAGGSNPIGALQMEVESTIPEDNSDIRLYMHGYNSSDCYFIQIIPHTYLTVPHNSTRTIDITRSGWCEIPDAMWKKIKPVYYNAKRSSSDSSGYFDDPDVFYEDALNDSGIGHRYFRIRNKNNINIAVDLFIIWSINYRDID